MKRWVGCMQEGGKDRARRWEGCGVGMTWVRNWEGGGHGRGGRQDEESRR